MAHRHVNAVIVGSGAGGGIVAKELSEAGLSVVLLERGGWPNFYEHPHDELISQIWYAPIAAAFGPDDARNFRMVRDYDGSWRKVLPSDPGDSNIAACVGSGTSNYGAMAWRFLETDFRMRSVYGSVEGSTLEDWPISYADLEPFYQKAEWEIGVSGDDSRNPFAPPRTKPQPYTLEGRILEPAAARMGLHPFPIPMNPVLTIMALAYRVSDFIKTEWKGTSLRP